MGEGGWLEKKVNFCLITLEFEMKVALLKGNTCQQLETQNERTGNRSVAEMRELEVVYKEV